MPLGRIGGLLILAGLVTFAGAVILAISGNAVGLGARGVGGLLVLTTLGLLGVGCERSPSMAPRPSPARPSGRALSSPPSGCSPCW